MTIIPLKDLNDFVKDDDDKKEFIMRKEQWELILMAIDKYMSFEKCFEYKPLYEYILKKVNGTESTILSITLSKSECFDTHMLVSNYALYLNGNKKKCKEIDACLEKIMKENSWDNHLLCKTNKWYKY